MRTIEMLGAARREVAHRANRNESDLVYAIQRLADWGRATGLGQPSHQFYAEIRQTTGLWKSRQGARQWRMAKRVRL